MWLIPERIVLMKNFDAASSIPGGFVPKPLKRLMQETREIVSVPNVPAQRETVVGHFVVGY
jgi:hypothetical protein